MIESVFFPSLALVMQPAPEAQISAAPSAPATPRFTAENRAAIRCSAAFAIIGARQARDTGTREWPELSARGREFFVVTLAGLMDEHGLDRMAIEREVRVEAEKLVKAGEVDKIMPACLAMLQTSGV